MQVHPTSSIPHKPSLENTKHLHHKPWRTIDIKQPITTTPKTNTKHKNTPTTKHQKNTTESKTTELKGPLAYPLAPQDIYTNTLLQVQPNTDVFVP